jgi:hypothetical protein
MISAKTRGLLAQCCLQLASMEHDAESLRQQLCANAAFEPYSYFQQIAEHDTLTLDAIKELACYRGVTVRVQGLIGMILAHDTDFDGALGYYE